MKLPRLQRCLIALVFVTFLLCMLVAIGFISSQPSEDVSGALHKLIVSATNNLGDFVTKRPWENMILTESRTPLLESVLHRGYSKNRKRYSVSSININFGETSSKSCVETTDKTSDNLPEPNYNVHVFYYPWYGNPTMDQRYLHWNHRILPHWKPEVSARYRSGRHSPPDDIGASFYPRLGPYSSKDPAVIDDHMRQIRRSSAGVLSVSWYPPGEADTEGHDVNSIVPQLLDAAEKYNLKVCLHIEPYDNRSDATLRSNLEYIVNRYGNHSAFYRWPSSNLPVYYIYDSYKVADDMWSSLLSADGSNTLRGTTLDGVFLGLVVERVHMNQLIRCGFDGYYSYFATDGFTYGSTSRHWDAMAKHAAANRVVFVPSVGPGYDDTPIRPWNAENKRDRDRGFYYERSFSEAIKVLPAAISITSFNEWGEGTQIEEATPKKTDGRTYSDYQPDGVDFYLQLTRKWTCRFTNKML